MAVAVEQVRDAIIIAGGEGRRMRPLTTDRPKAAIQISQQSRVIDLHLRELVLAGVDRTVVLAVSHGRDQLMAYVGDGSRYGVDIKYSVEEEPLGRGGAINQARQMLPVDARHYLVANGDNLWKFDWKAMIDYHLQSGVVATILEAPFKVPFGVLQVGGREDNRHNLITGFREKPVEWINAGNYVFSFEINSLLPPKGEIEDTTFPQLAQRKKLGGWKLGPDEFWMPFDNYPDHYEAAKKAVCDLWPDEEFLQYPAELVGNED